MKRKNGFTLVELLAVIVILAIIALIAVPIVMNVIEDSKVGAAKSSALGYLDAVEKQMARNMMDSDKTNDFNDGSYEISELETKGVKVKGDKPTEGWVQIEQGKIKDYSFKIGKYFINPDSKNQPEAKKSGEVKEKPVGGSSSTQSGPTKVAAQSGETHKGILYMDPTNLSATCNASNSVSTTGTKTGCMKFYIFDDSGDSYKMILDHNTTANGTYETSGTYKEYAQAEIKTTVDSDTTGWASGLNPRLITANEVTSITNTTTFNGSSSTWFYLDGTGDKKQKQASSSQGASQYAWLFDYTNRCTSYGCNTADSSTNGYWTSSAVSDYPQFAWSVDYNGYLFYHPVEDSSRFGVRPVVTLSKSVIK